MRLRLFDRFRRSVRWRWPARRSGSRTPPTARQDPVAPPGGSGGRHRRVGSSGAAASLVAVGQGPSPPAEVTFPSPVSQTRSRAERSGRSGRATHGGSRRMGVARAAVRVAPAAAVDVRAADVTVPQQAASAEAKARLPWYEVAHAHKLAEGRRDCGPLEEIIHREWEPGVLPPVQVVRAIDRLAELPQTVSRRLADNLDAIHVGPGGVPDLDSMSRLRGIPLPSGRATWDACAGAYGERKIIVGTRPSAAPDVVCHEVGHALDDIDGSGGHWQSDTDEFRALYNRCLPHLLSDFHRQEGQLGRREFFADSFAAIASGQRPALVDMLGGDTRIALDVMLYFNMRYGI